MRTFVINILLVMPFILNAQSDIDSIKIYAMDFGKSTRYGFFESDVIKACSPVIIGSEEAKKFSKLLQDHIASLPENQENSEDGFDLRMVCIIFFSDSKVDTIGFSYLDYMSFNGKKTTPRNNKLLRLFSHYLKDKGIKRSIRKYAKDG